MQLARHEERWRERAKARAKCKGKSARKEKPKVKTETGRVIPEGITLDRFKVPAHYATITFEETPKPLLDPRQKCVMEQVAEVLNEFKLNIHDLGVNSVYRARTRFTMEPPNIHVMGRSRVKPLPGVVSFVMPDGTINLHGSSGIGTTATNAVRLARKHMIELCIHEIDEWLFQAGLGPNPHNWSNGAVPDEEVGKLHPRFAE